MSLTKLNVLIIKKLVIRIFYSIVQSSIVQLELHPIKSCHMTFIKKRNESMELSIV